MNTKARLRAYFALLIMAFLSLPSIVQAGGPAKEGKVYDPKDAVMHHISDAHHFNLYGDNYLPLPCIAYTEKGMFFTLSSAFGPFANHGMGSKAVDGFVMYGDQLMRIKGDFPQGVHEVELGGHHEEAAHVEPTKPTSEEDTQTVSADGISGGTEAAKEEQVSAKPYFMYQGKKYELEAASALQNLGSSWQDFSITKNVATMILGFLLLLFIFRSIAKSYERREGQAPKGLQSLLEPVLVFLRDDVMRPALGNKWEKYFPFLGSLFFFILINNLMGLIPFFPGSANVTGNIGVTMALAFITFLVVNFNGNKHYWEHVFWMPGVPAVVKLILTPIEILGLFIKPITLFIRLFANITAGHIIILSLVSLIFVFKSTGQLGGEWGGVALAVPFVFALNFLELFVAFLQAYVFTLLASLYIGSAIEEHHHHEEGAH